MGRAARIGDKIQGVTSGEHSGHTDNPHPSCPIYGEITTGSENVFINTKKAARVGDSTVERDCCCIGGKGVISEGSTKVYINMKRAARVGDKISPHNGVASISTEQQNGSHNVIIY